jgi:solute carrier family 35 protein F5
MVVYLPIAIIKDWIYTFCRKNYSNNLCSSFSNLNELDIPLIPNELNHDPESTQERCYASGSDLDEREECWPLRFKHEECDEKKCEPSSWEIAKCSFYLAPVWFITEYLSNSALANTSVASTTVLTSTSGLFTLFFGALLGQESVTVAKVVAVLVSMAGVAMTTIGKTWAPDEMLSASE